jgi:hypothetical protein
LPSARSLTTVVTFTSSSLILLGCCLAGGALCWFGCLNDLDSFATIGWVKFVGSLDVVGRFDHPDTLSTFACFFALGPLDLFG